MKLVCSTRQPASKLCASTSLEVIRSMAQGVHPFGGLLALVMGRLLLPSHLPGTQWLVPFPWTLTWFLVWRTSAFLWVSTRAGRSRLPDPPAWPGTQRDTDRVGGRKQDV